MLEVCVRRSDGVILQFGHSLGELKSPDGTIVLADIVELSQEQEEAIRAASTSRGALVLELDGSISLRPPDPPQPEPIDPDVALCNAFALNPKPTADDATAALQAYLRLAGYGGQK